MGAILDRLKDLVPSVRTAKERKGIQAATLLQNELRAAVGRPGGPHNASRPGEPPRKRTGHYQASLFARFDKSARAIVAGSTDPRLMRILEATRPHFGPTLQRVRPKMLEILKGV
jgi:hypothetical protein